MTAIAGSLEMRPGVAAPHNVRSTRRNWVSPLVQGRPIDQVPGLVATVLSLCGAAHRCASTLAIEAAAAMPGSAKGTIDTMLHRETVREHLYRIALDWPRLLAGGDGGALATAALASMQRCPLAGARASPAQLWPALSHWLRDEWLHTDPARWLQAWLAEGIDWFHAWSRRHTGWLGALLRTARQADVAWPRGVVLRPLFAHGSEVELRRLAADIASRPGFDRLPQWRDAPASTGSWARLRHPAEPVPRSVGELLGYRLAELVRLCLPDAGGESGAQWLGWGVVAVGERQCLAWVEMARGLLIHLVRLGQPQSGAVATVLDYHVVAPTEWNFHPAGLAAQVLATLSIDDPEVRARVNLLTAALDPCVPVEICAPNEDTAGYQESSHA